MTLLDTLKEARDALNTALTQHIYDASNGEAPEPDCEFTAAIAKLDAEIAALEPAPTTCYDAEWAIVADGEGWGVDPENACIVRADEAGPIFLSDAAALEHVTARAAAGSAPHKAALAYIEANREPRKWQVRLQYTTRAFAEWGIEAVDEAAAREIIKANRERWTAEEVGMDVDGDEIFYLVSDDIHAPEIEIDARDAGEPYSWTACEIVKKLAAINAKDHTDAVYNELWQLVGEAATACAVEG